jgi:hypothetical protein
MQLINSVYRPLRDIASSMKTMLFRLQGNMPKRGPCETYIMLNRVNGFNFLLKTQ